MKKKFAIVAIFLTTYIVFLVATLPIRVVLSQVNLPKEISLSGVTGTVWHSQIDQLTLGKALIEQVDMKLSFWSLFTLTPKLDISFGDPLLSGPEGKLVVDISSDNVTATNVDIFVKANDVAQQLTLPLPVSAQGNVELNVKEISISLVNYQCKSAKGEATWMKAGVVALEQNIKLGQFKTDISCEEGAIALLLSPRNDLGLTFTTYVRQGGKISGSGYLKPGNKFPRALNDALPFLGKKDNQGRYRLSF